MACNTAIFYDIENLMGIFNGKTNTGLHLDEIYKRVLAMDGVTGVSIQRAYADWAIPMHRNLKNSVLQVGIEPIQIFNTNQNDRVKNAADISLIIDAVDLAARRPEIQNFVIASGDGIFAFLSKKLHEHGKRVIGCSFEKIANAIFRNSCDFFIGLEKSDETVIAKSTTRDINPGTKKETPEAKAMKKRMAMLPKTKYTDTLLAANIEVSHDEGDTSAVIQVVRRLVEALFVGETKDMPGLEISIFANYVKHYLPKFNVKQLGFRGIAEFMRFVLTGSIYCTYSVADNVVLMALRTAAQAVNGKIVDDVDGLLIVTPEGERYNSVFNVPVDSQFVYTIQKQEVHKPKRGRKSASKKPATEAVTITEEPAASAKDTIRKLIKNRFEELSRANAVPSAEISKLTTLEYAKKTFGIRAPVLIELDQNSSLLEQRKQGGKVKYWKETFEFGGKQYLVYKEWANLHKERFMAWFASHKKES